MTTFREILRRLPAVDRVLAEPAGQVAIGRFGHEMVRDGVRRRLALLRQEILAGRVAAGDVPGRAAGLLAEVATDLAARVRDPYRAVVNASGILVHTNLGRAPLAVAAREAAWRGASRALALEFDLESGQRGSRMEPVRRVLAELFPGTTGLAVNNNAGAVLLALNSLARDREVILSRGELVEIGGSFRVPDILASSGARLVEVGTTNRTRAADYRAALGEATAVILRVHPSNFRQVGFTEAPTVDELVALGREAGVPVIVDQGSGNLHDLGPFGVVDEPRVGELLRRGVDIVTFSGDKLLGGPQAGLLVGREDLIERLARNPLARALRPDKLILAALVETLWIHRQGRAFTEIPVLARLAAPLAAVESRAAALREALRAGGVAAERVAIVAGTSKTGGGSSPAGEIPTALVALAPPGGASRLAASLRQGEAALLVRVAGDRVLVDLRTVDPEEDGLVREVLLARLRDAG
ncbi:MAG: L-seryl-tRNA(Sec) selenium transferase [Acidobacteriota bacterium]